MSEIPLRNTKKRNVFAFVELTVVKGRKVGFKVEVVRYNPKTELNKTLKVATMSVAEFNGWFHSGDWKTEGHPIE
jgi:hypothetical protein